MIERIPHRKEFVDPETPLAQLIKAKKNGDNRNDRQEYILMGQFIGPYRKSRLKLSLLLFAVRDVIDELHGYALSQISF
jgi:hypothetical protein